MDFVVEEINGLEVVKKRKKNKALIKFLDRNHRK